MAKTVNDRIAELEKSYNKTMAKANVLIADSRSIAQEIINLKRDAIGFLDGVKEIAGEIEHDFDDAYYYLKSETGVIKSEVLDFIQKMGLHIDGIDTNKDGHLTVRVEKPAYF